MTGTARARRVTRVTGGARSGKSSYALDAARAYAGRAFIATAEPTADEMRDRIARHREARGDSFITIEEPVDLAGALGSLGRDTAVAVVDCLTVWLGNLAHRAGGRLPERPGEVPEIAAFLTALAGPSCDLVIVTNEVGMGIVPENDAARAFRDLAGRLNQRIAALADRVVFMVSGVPLVVKNIVKDTVEETEGAST